MGAAPRRWARPGRPALRVVAATFLANGALTGVWVPHVAAVKAALGLGEAALGAAILAFPLGGILVLLAAGALMRRLGSRTVTVAGSVVFAGGLPLVLIAPGYGWLLAALLLFGIGNGLQDVGMNAQAISAEAQRSRPVMARLHALYSVGAFLGALAGGLALDQGMSPAANGMATALVALALTLPWSRGLAGPAARAQGESPPAGPRFVLPTRALLGISLLAAISIVAEAALNDWTAVFMREVLSSSPAVAGAAFAAAQLTMAVGRFAGDRALGIVSRRRLLAGGAGLAAVSLVTVATAAHPAVAVAGFAAMGLGLANTIPLLFAAAGRLPGLRPGSGIATTMLMAYIGGVASPPLIGVLAEATDLGVALSTVAGLLALLAVSSRWAPLAPP